MLQRKAVTKQAELGNISESCQDLIRASCYRDHGEETEGINGMMAYTVGLERSLLYTSRIDSIHVTYDNNVKPLLAEKHGGMGGNKSAQIKLHFPEEVFISVSGHYCPVVYGGGPVIRSLTFKSNKRTYGPFEHPSIS
nr:jacalin-related lectin 19-like [Tanacetum cinerariifolium]